MLVVVGSATGDSVVIEEALARGAAGFIPKDCSGKVMLGALKLVLSGGAYVPPAMFYVAGLAPVGRCREPAGRNRGGACTALP